MAGDDIKQCSEVAILNANYMAKVLEPHYKVLFTNENGKLRVKDVELFHQTDAIFSFICSNFLFYFNSI